jgi:hypothetical protein
VTIASLPESCVHRRWATVDGQPAATLERAHENLVGRPHRANAFRTKDINRRRDRDNGAIARSHGYDTLYATDHPAPSIKWLGGGGHIAHDPFSLLSFIAAATKTIRLDTSILVLPYRNPLLLARAIATLDVILGGLFPDRSEPADQTIEYFHELASIRVTWVAVPIPGRMFAE